MWVTELVIMSRVFLSFDGSRCLFSIVWLPLNGIALFFLTPITRIQVYVQIFAEFIRWLNPHPNIDLRNYRTQMTLDMHACNMDEENWIHYKMTSDY